MFYHKGHNGFHERHKSIVLFFNTEDTEIDTEEYRSVFSVLNSAFSVFLIVSVVHPVVSIVVK